MDIVNILSSSSVPFVLNFCNIWGRVACDLLHLCFLTLDHFPMSLKITPKRHILTPAAHHACTLLSQPPHRCHFVQLSHAGGYSPVLFWVIILVSDGSDETQLWGGHQAPCATPRASPLTWHMDIAAPTREVVVRVTWEDVLGRVLEIELPRFDTLKII